MSVTKVLNKGRVVWQIPDEQVGVPEAAVLIHLDNGGTLVLEQENRYIDVSKAAVPEICRVLKEVAAKA